MNFKVYAKLYGNSRWQMNFSWSLFYLRIHFDLQHDYYVPADQSNKINFCDILMTYFIIGSKFSCRFFITKKHSDVYAHNSNLSKL